MVEMRTIQTFLLICITLPWAKSKDIVCGNNTSETVLIGVGDSFSFKTQAGPTYEQDTKCVVKYKLRSSCSQFRFSCSQFDVENKDQNCEKLDRMTITVGGQRKSYCQRKGPNMTFTRPGFVKVSFLSGKTREAAGADCSARCGDPAGQTVVGATTSRQKRTTTITTNTDSGWTTAATYDYTSYDSYDTPGTTSYDYYTDTTTSYGEETSGINAVSDLLRLLPLLRIPIHENVDVPGSWDSAIISSDNILHDVTISYKGGRYNVLMEDVASIINIPETLRNVKVFHHDGTKHFRIVRHRGQEVHNGGHGGKVGKDGEKKVHSKTGMKKGHKKPSAFLGKKKKSIKKKLQRKWIGK